MPSEKKGRFTVSVTEQQPKQPSAAPSAAPTGSTQQDGGQTRAVKRGRFLVSCLPCSRQGLAPTLSLQEEERVGLLHSSSQLPAVGSSSSSSDDGTRVHTGMDHSAAAAAAAEVSSPCPVAGQLSPARSPEPRRVRFSETAECLLPTAFSQQQGCVPPAQLLQPQASAPAQVQLQDAAAHASTPPASKRPNRQQAEVSSARQLKHTRSYCSGRFMIQEAVSVPEDGPTAGAVLQRSISAPECAAAGSMSSSLSSCSSMQSLQGCVFGGPFVAVQQGSGSGGGSPGNSSSGSAFAQLGAQSCGADLLAANQLMSGLLQHQQYQQQQHEQQLQFAQAQLLYFPTPMHDSSLYAASSLPAPALGSACFDEECGPASSLLCASNSSSGMGTGSAAGAAALGASASSRRHGSSSSGKRRNGGGSSSNLLRGCYSGGAELLASAAAAAAAAGHHGPSPSHQHIAPKRSASMTYFRRGRFLVQTTMG